MVSHRHILCHGRIRESIYIHSPSKERAMRRSCKIKHPDFLPFHDMLSLSDRHTTRRHLAHPDPQERHKPDLRIITLDEYHGPRRRRRQVLLCRQLTRWIGLGAVVLAEAR